MIDGNLKKRLITSIILFTALVLLLNYNFVLLYCIILFGTISILEFTNLLKKINTNTVLKIFCVSIFIIYILYFSLLIFYNLNHGKEIKVITVFILLICIFSDIGGLIFGKTFKGPKLTSISPNKTISGSIGSIISSLIILFIFINLYNYGIPIYKLFILTISISVLSQAGDIFFSYVKRKARVKDTGSLLPGHGGVLDRFDGILIGLPIGNELFYFLI
tara:strand:+ start:457 stop:1113 length:657 start_codon:yes stop_codon:yes gene_type:complete